MATQFRGNNDSSGDRLYTPTHLLNWNAAYTAMAWFRNEVDRNEFGVVWAFSGSGGDNTASYEYAGLAGDGTSLTVDAHPAMGSWTGADIPLNEWHHYAVVRQSITGNLLIYFDGELVGTMTDADATGRESPVRLDLAGFGSFNYSSMHGSIAYFREWTAALSQAEIQAEMNATAAVRSSNLYGDYPLAGGTGVRDQDISGNGRHLIEIGAPVEVAPPALSTALSGSASLTLTATGTLTVLGVSSARTMSSIGQLTITTGVVGTTFDVDVGFQPKVVIFNWNPATATAEPNPAIALNLVAGIGAFVSPTSRFAAQAFESNAAATMINNRVQGNDCCIIVTNSSDAVAGKADINAITATGFQLIIDAVFSVAQRVNYIALGGDGVENVAIGTLNLGATTGNLDLTSLAFQPDAVLFVGTGQTTTNSSLTPDSGLTIGAADAARQWVFTGGSNDAAATSQTVSYGSDSECIAFPSAAVTDTPIRSSFVQFLSNGFRVNRVEQSLSNRIVFFVAIKTARVRVDNLLTQTNTTTPITKSLGWSPISTLLASHAKPKSTADTVQDHHELTVGMFTSPTSRLATSARDNDNAADAVAGVAMSTAYAYVKQNANVRTGDSSNPASIDGAMDVVSIDTDGFTLIMDDADPAQSFVGFISFGTTYNHPVNGETTIAFTASADLTVSNGAAVALEGAATLTLTQAGALTIAKPLAGAAALALTPSGELAISKPLAGTATLVFTPSGALAVVKSLAGAEALVLTATGTLTVQGSAELEGTAALVFTPSSALSVGKPLAGTTALAITPSGALTVVKPLIGAAALALTPSGALTITKPLVGAAALVFTPSGALTVQSGVVLVGAATLTLTPSGALAVGKPLAGAAAITLTPSGALTVVKPLIGAAALALTPSGVMTITKPLAGAAALMLTSSGALTVVRVLAGAAALTFTASAELLLINPLTGAATLAFAVDGELLLIKPLIGATALVFAVDGGLHVTHPIGLTRLVQVAAEPPIVRVGADPPIARVAADPPIVRVLGKDN